MQNQPNSSSGEPSETAPKERFRWLFWLLALVILAVAVGLFIGLKNTAPAAPAIEPKVRSWSVATISAEPTEVVPTLPVVGSVVSPLGAMLSAQTTGAVQTIHHLAGDSVQAGEPLITLDNDTQRLNLATQKAQLVSAQAQLAAEIDRAKSDQAALQQERRLQQLAQSAYNRQEKLRQRDLGAQSRVDDAAQALAQRKLAVIQRQLLVAQAASRRNQLQSAVDQAQSAFELAQLELKRTVIAAPFAARVQTVSVSVGQQIAPGQALVSLYSPERLELRVQLTPRRLVQLQTAVSAGKSDQITASGTVDDQAIRARLGRLGADVATGSGSVDAFFVVTSGSQALQPGRTIEMDVTMPPLANVVAMPPAALYGNNRAYLLAEPDATTSNATSEQSGKTDSETDSETKGQDYAVMRSISVNVVGEQRRPDGQLWILGRSSQFTANAELITTQIPGAADGVAVKKVEPIISSGQAR